MKKRAVILLAGLLCLGGCQASETRAAKAEYEGVGPTAKLEKRREGPRSIEIIIERGEPKTRTVYVPIPDDGGDSDAK